MWAARHGHLAMVETLLANGLNLLQVGRDGRPEKGGPFLLFRGCVGDELLPSYVGIIMVVRIPMKQPGFFSGLRWVRSGEEFDL